MQNAFARRRTSAVVALIVASGAALAACGTEEAATPAGQTPVANVQPGGQAPALGTDREHLAQSPDGFPDPTGDPAISGKLRLLLEERAR
jgi:hypothetical protein